MELEENEVLNQIRNRPRFIMHTDLSQKEYEAQLRNYLKYNDAFAGRMGQHGAVIKYKTKENPFWKPRLTLTTEKQGNGTEIRGIFGPSDAVWTFFIALYVVFGLLAMLFYTWWSIQSKLNSNDNPWALTLAGIFTTLLILTYIASWIGKGKSKDEISKLREFAENSTLPHQRSNTKPEQQDRQS